MDIRLLSRLYDAAHDEMRNIDGLQPQDAFDELLKYVFFKERDEEAKEPVQFHAGMSDAKNLDDAARAIRIRFSNYLNQAFVVPDKWRIEGIQLSDRALIKIHSIFQGCKLSSTSFDIRSSALRAFLSGPVRKSLGIFLTPEAVVREMVTALNPTAGQKVLDPACGSATFLMDAAIYAAEDGHPLDIFGVDKSPRMIQLAEFNCGHLNSMNFHRAVGDSLSSLDEGNLPSWYQEKSFDVIFTNPPFGVSVDAHSVGFDSYAVCTKAEGKKQKNQASELMFVERCLSLLKPDGWLGIVLPRSIATNQGSSNARLALSKLGAVRGVVTLPSETFLTTGANTTTVILFVQRYGETLAPDTQVETAVARIDNVGFDSTGRPRVGSQLVNLGIAVRAAMLTRELASGVVLAPAMPASDTFTRCAELVGEQTSGEVREGRELAEFISVVGTGATPARAAYTDEGLFLVKVGNLTGSGVNWVARERNFVGQSVARKYNSVARMLQPGDILLTSSAHAARYIGKKVDIVRSIPAEVGGRASFTGEVMLIRPADSVDPYKLLAYLRLPAVMLTLQSKVRGQTAHLHPTDVLSLKVDTEIFTSDLLNELASILRVEAELNDSLNGLAFDQLRLHGALQQASLG